MADEIGSETVSFPKRSPVWTLADEVNYQLLLLTGGEPLIPSLQLFVEGLRTPMVDSDSASFPQSTPQFQTNINTAGWPELALMPGVGPELAQKIVEYRDTHGPFTDLSELDNVPGIGPSTMQKMEPFVTLERVEETSHPGDIVTPGVAAVPEGPSVPAPGALDDVMEGVAPGLDSLADALAPRGDDGGPAPLVWPSVPNLVPQAVSDFFDTFQSTPTAPIDVYLDAKQREEDQMGTAPTTLNDLLIPSPTPPPAPPGPLDDILFGR